MQACLDKCLLESEVDEGFVEVSPAFKDRMDKPDDQNAATRKRKVDLLRRIILTLCLM